MRRGWLPERPKRRKKRKPRPRHRKKSESFLGAVPDTPTSELTLKNPGQAESSSDEQENVTLVSSSKEGQCSSLPDFHKPKEHSENADEKIEESPTDLLDAKNSDAFSSVESQSTADSGIGSSQEMLLDGDVSALSDSDNFKSGKEEPVVQTIEEVNIDVTILTPKLGRGIKRKATDQLFSSKARKVNHEYYEHLLTDKLPVALKTYENANAIDDVKVKDIATGIFNFMNTEKGSDWMTTDQGRAWLRSSAMQGVFMSLLHGSPSMGVNEDVTMCVMCRERPKNAAIIHGKISHQATCYSCAKTLFEQRARCPVCRRKILTITKHIIA